MNKIITLLLLGGCLVSSDYDYNGSTTATVVLAGAVIKAKNTETKKYFHKNCPVCKGKMVDCNYCEKEKPLQIEYKNYEY